MFNTPEEYAKKMLEIYYGNAEDAKIELYNSARVYRNVPCRFFYDVSKAIDKLVLDA